MNLATLGLEEQSRLLGTREVSPIDLVEAYLDRIEKLDHGLHSLTQVFSEEARTRARELAKEKPGGPLWGIPWVAKDLIATRTGRTTCASRSLESFRSPYDATVIERLEAAGAILLGKSNMDEFAMGSSTENSAFGVTRNPWNPDCVPGGSSGGAAAAVAAHLATFGLGSDTGGSIRQPASFCGVVGLKPTYGRVSRYGLVAFASSLDQIGPIGKTTRDVALVLDAIAGHDPRDSTSLDTPGLRIPDPRSQSLADEIEDPPAGLRIGVPRRFLEHGMDPDARRAFEAVLAKLESAGVTLVDVALDHARYAVAVYYIVATAEASSNLARYDGVRYSRRADTAKNLASLYERSRTEGFGDEVKRRILLGTYVLSAGYYEAYYSKAQKVRTLLRRDFETAFATCDTILMPTSPGPAFRLGEHIKDPLEMYVSDIFTVPANLTGLPAISIPSGTVRDLPLGVQLYGPRLGEHGLLRAARWVERLIGFERPELPLVA